MALCVAGCGSSFVLLLYIKSFCCLWRFNNPVAYLHIRSIGNRANIRSHWIRFITSHPLKQSRTTPINCESPPEKINQFTSNRQNFKVNMWMRTNEKKNTRRKSKKLSVWIFVRTEIAFRLNFVGKSKHLKKDCTLHTVSICCIYGNLLIKTKLHYANIRTSSAHSEIAQWNRSIIIITTKTKLYVLSKVNVFLILKTLYHRTKMS